MKPAPHVSGFALLLPHVAKPKRKDFADYVASLVNDDERFGIDGDFLGFMDDYANYAALLQRKADIAGRPMRGEKERRITVYDVGCATALQHVLFDPRIDYVGIDNGLGSWTPRFFRAGCTFIRGRFADAFVFPPLESSFRLAERVQTYK